MLRYPSLPCGEYSQAEKVSDLPDKVPRCCHRQQCMVYGLCASQPFGRVTTSFQWFPAAVSLYSCLFPSAAGLLFSLPAAALSLLLFWLSLLAFSWSYKQREICGSLKIDTSCSIKANRAVKVWDELLGSLLCLQRFLVLFEVLESVTHLLTRCY